MRAYFKFGGDAFDFPCGVLRMTITWGNAEKITDSVNSVFEVEEWELGECLNIKLNDGKWYNISREQYGKQMTSYEHLRRHTIKLAAVAELAISLGRELEADKDCLCCVNNTAQIEDFRKALAELVKQ